MDAERGLLPDQCDLAEDMEEKDSHLQSELGKRRRAIQSLKWTIKPPRTPVAKKSKTPNC
ncbi:phage portal protein family protein [Erwinia tracheiphila]|uniref:phage portal protein family protein n=1 Tax=Erwinia tracheiphila TaxID=65700 RepID=UPI003AB04501